MALVFEMFPEEYVQLNIECSNGLHPKLEIILAGIHPDEHDMKLAFIATYCEVILNGVYTHESRIALCEILRKKLIEKRERPPGSIILLN